ncbi:MAG: class I tRNA ligase family protein [Minisyncoccia bacterium]
MASMKGSEDKAPKTLKSDLSKREEKILEFWNEKEIFKKTLERSSSKGNFVFYEGPPTANAKPALHHLEARVFKDIIPRYKTMQGFHVRRKGGWDTHGLPVELQIEKKLGLKSKKEIEIYGIEKFNKECKQSVFDYVHDWEVFTDRIGYWVDKKDAYYTFDTDYIESVWNILKTVDEEKLLYKDYKVLPWCPRCGTALSSHELAQGYQDDKDLSVTVKFKLKGFDKGYFLAWTTTPWTLPGNVALAVGKDITYVEAKVGDEILVLAKDRLAIITEPFEIIAEHKGSECVGMEYEPLYPFMREKFGEKDKIAFEKSYQVYSADFVNTEDGTGVVHTAVMYGQDDFVLGNEIGLPKYHLVKEDGYFADGMGFLSDRFVKDEEVAVGIIKDLAHRGLLFKKEKYEHSYPHCWRCSTPLIYYARDSWYIAISKLRDELVRENEDIHWEPEHIKEGRFGEWLREIKDWAISRERYWGTPLPIWSDKDGNYRVVGSVEDLKKYSKKSGNKYFVMRHGETEGNVKKILNLNFDVSDPLTNSGTEKVKETARFLSDKSIDLIIVSPFSRTQETAVLIAKIIGLSKDKIITDSGLGEWNTGREFNHKSVEDFFAVRNKSEDRYAFKVSDGESYNEVLQRLSKFMYETDEKYKDKNILIISHGAPCRAIEMISKGFSYRNLSKITKEFKNFDNAEIREIDFVKMPHNDKYEIDLHKPYIDSVELVDEKGDPLKRVKEVMDVWFDSGSMPFAQDHHPFNKEKLAYPADFISEAIDQTRGWFYTLHAIGILMGRGKAYKNVICLGHILDKDGRKMSKSIGNILDPWELMDKYGVDALRLWMYTVNQPGDSKNFDEKTVDEILKKVFNPALNILAFYELYKDSNTRPNNQSKNVLDKWILSRLGQLIKNGTESLEKFQVFESARLTRDFINDFSTWYIRRSRDRFKSDNKQERNDALSTTLFVLFEFVKYMAPFTPFFAEDVYQKIKSNSDPESVHLCDWPKGDIVDEILLQDMQKVREVVSGALELRQKAGHKVRQPLASLTIPQKFSRELLDIIADEVNVKKVKVGKEIKLDTNLTEELKEEGIARDIIRAIQDARKTEKLSPSDNIKIVVCTNKQNLIDYYVEMIKLPTQITEILYSKEKQNYIVESDGEISFSIMK